MEDQVEVLGKYEFIKNGIDNWTLKYKNKEIKFNSKVEFIKELQDVPRKARVKMVMDLAKQGMTVQDLVVEHTEGSKTIADHSNKDFIEKGYIQEAQLEVMNDIITKMFGMGYMELLLDIGLENEEESAKFGEDIGAILRGQIPRGN